MSKTQWGYEFDMNELEPGRFQSSYWLISPTGELTERTVMPVRDSEEDSLSEAQEAGRLAASRKNQEIDGAPTVEL